jgi:hypothetical protein
LSPALSMVSLYPGKPHASRTKGFGARAGGRIKSSKGAGEQCGTVTPYHDRVQRASSAFRLFRFGYRLCVEHVSRPRPLHSLRHPRLQPDCLRYRSSRVYPGIRGMGLDGVGRGVPHHWSHSPGTGGLTGSAAAATFQNRRFLAGMPRRG